MWIEDTLSFRYNRLPMWQAFNDRVSILFSREQASPQFLLLDEREIGSGGSSLIFRRRYTNDYVEVEKRLLPKLQGKPEFENLQVREFQILKRLDHPLVVKAHRLERRRLFLNTPSHILVLEDLKGVPLSDYQIFLAGLDSRARRAWVWTFLGQLRSVMNYLHGRGVVHGDMCPENILIQSSGFLKIIDFATAEASDVAPSRFHVAGKNNFRSPEVKEGAAPSAESDLFAVGKIFQFAAGESLLQEPDIKAEVDSLLGDRQFRTKGFSFEALERISIPSPETTYKPSSRKTKFVATYSSIRLWGRALGFSVLLVAIAGATTSWMPQSGYLSVNVLPPQISYSIDVLGSHLWRDRPLSQKVVPAGRIQISFRGAHLRDRVITKTLLVEPSEDVKVFEDFRKLDILSE